MGGIANCPNCGGAKTVKGKLNEWRYLNAFDLVPMAPRSCDDCGHVWEPPPPKWALVLLTVLGFLMTGLTVYTLSVGASFGLRNGIFSIMGVVLIVICIQRLLTHSPTTITQGRREGEPVTKEPAAQ